jgi:hypothetical protein
MAPLPFPPAPLEDSMNKTRIAQCASLLAAAGFANAQATFAEKNIPLDAAMEMARASLDDCRAKGFKVTVTVLNRHARTAVVGIDKISKGLGG